MTKSATVYTVIKDFIFRNQILPGQRIDIEDLSKKLGISSTPLREALNRLSYEGYISHDPRRGYSVQLITTDEIEKLYGVCEALETYAIEQAVSKVTSSDLADLKNNLMRYKDVIGEAYTRERFLINNQFHLKVAALSGNEAIVKILSQTYEKFVWKWKVENINHGRGPEAYHEHSAIYTSLESRDLTGAVNNMRNHIIKSKTSVVTYLKWREDLFKESNEPLLNIMSK